MSPASSAPPRQRRAAPDGSSRAGSALGRLAALPLVATLAAATACALEPKSTGDLPVESRDPAAPAAPPPSIEALEQEPPVAAPWTPPDDPIVSGPAGAAQLLAEGRPREALEHLRSVADANARASDEAPAGSDDPPLTALELDAIVARAARLTGDARSAVEAHERIAATPRWDALLPRDVLRLELARARLDYARTLDPPAADLQRVTAAAELAKALHVAPNRYAAPMRVLRAEALAEVSGGDTDKGRRKAATAAAAALAELVALYPRHTDLGRFELARARAVERAGRLDEAVDVYRKIVITRGEEAAAREAWAALEALDAAGTIRLRPLTWAERLAQAAYARDLSMFEFSLQVTESLMKEDLTPSQRAKTTLARAWSRYKTRDYDGCVADMQTLYAASPTRAHEEHLVRCLAYGGRYREAADLYERLANAKGRSKAARRAAQWRALELAARGGDHARALALLEDWEKHGRGEAEQRRWLHAWLPHRLGRHREAIAGFAAVEAHSGDERHEAATYFRGRLLLASEVAEERALGVGVLRRLVDAAWQAMGSDHARGGFTVYYGLMARERLLAAGVPVPEPPHFSPMPLAERTFGYLDTRASFRRLLDELEDDAPTLRRADTLHRIGYLDEAQREYRVAAYELLRGTSTAGGTISRSEEVEVGVSWTADLSSAAPVLTRAGRARLRDPERAARWRAGMRELAAALGEPYLLARFTPADELNYGQRYYLRAYREAVERTAVERGVDPFHIWALMYTESRFRRYVLSQVGARGAMQIYPPSWRRRLVAAGTFDGRLDVDSLFDIDAALGACLRSVKELLVEFDGHYALYYGSYNGGGHNVRRWLWAQQQEGELDLDDFVEEIEFRETRRYVRRVIGVYAGYHAIYGGGLPRIATSMDGIFTAEARARHEGGVPADAPE